MGNSVPKVRIFDVPFLFHDTVHARGLLDSEIGQYGVVWRQNGFRHLTNSRRDADLRVSLVVAYIWISGGGAATHCAGTPSRMPEQDELPAAKFAARGGAKLMPGLASEEGDLVARRSDTAECRK